MSSPRKRGSTPRAAAPTRPAATSAKATSAGSDVSSLVEQLARILRHHDLSELVVDQEHTTIRLARQREVVTVAHATTSEGRPAAPPPPPVDAAPAASGHAHRPTVEASAASALVYITSPFVGTFYRSPSPEAGSFVEVGSRVRKGQVLCIVEAMKLMNEIESDADGTIVAVLAENGQPVEFGEPLFQIRP